MTCGPIVEKTPEILIHKVSTQLSVSYPQTKPTHLYVTKRDQALVIDIQIPTIRSYY